MGVWVGVSHFFATLLRHMASVPWELCVCGWSSSSSFADPTLLVSFGFVCVAWSEGQVPPDDREANRHSLLCMSFVRVPLSLNVSSCVCACVSLVCIGVSVAFL